MKTKKFLSLLLGGVAALALAGCGSNSGFVSDPVSQASASASESASSARASQVPTSTALQGETSSTPASPSLSSAPASSAAGESIATNGGESIALSALEHQDEGADSTVYYTGEISPRAMTAIYASLGRELTGERIAVKLSTGEPPASNYLIRISLKTWCSR